MNLFTNEIELQITNFIEYLKSIVDDENKLKIENNIGDLKKNQFKLFMFLLTLNEQNKDKHVDEFCCKFNIYDHEHKHNINQYYELFIQLKSLMN